MPYAYTAPRFMYGAPTGYGYGAPRMGGGYLGGLLGSLGSLTPLLGLGAAALAYKNRGNIGQTIGNLGQSVSNFIQGNGFTPGNMQSGMNVLNNNVSSIFGNNQNTSGSTQVTAQNTNNQNNQPASGYDPNADYQSRIQKSIENTQKAQDKADTTKQKFLESSKGSNKTTAGYNQQKMMQDTIKKGMRAEKLDNIKSGIKNAVNKVGTKISEKNPVLASKAKSAMDAVKNSKVGRGATEIARSAKDAMKDAGANIQKATKGIRQATGIQKLQNKISDFKINRDKTNFIAKRDNVSKYTAWKTLKNEKATRKAAIDAARAAKQNLQTTKNNEAVNIATNQYKIAQNNAKMQSMIQPQVVQNNAKMQTMVPQPQVAQQQTANTNNQSNNNKGNRRGKRR